MRASRDGGTVAVPVPVIADCDTVLHCTRCRRRDRMYVLKIGSAWDGQVVREWCSRCDGSPVPDTIVGHVLDVVNVVGASPALA